MRGYFKAAVVVLLPRMLRPSFPLALLVSVLLHGLLLGAGELARLFAPAPVERTAAPRVEARLLPPHAVGGDAPVLKNTLAEAVAPSEAAAAIPPQARRPALSLPSRSHPALRAVERRAQRKLAEYIFYPPEAIEQGLEGEVRLLLRLAPDGTIIDARIASGSGHASLDEGALKAVQAMRRLPDAGVAELILPVVFRLQ